MDNPFELILSKLHQLEAKQNELLALYRAALVAAPGQPTEEYPITIEEAAKLLNISKHTLYQNKNRIKYTKQFGRLYFYASDLKAYVDSGRSYGYGKSL